MLSYRRSVVMSRSRELQSVSNCARYWARTWTHIHLFPRVWGSYPFDLKIGFPPVCSFKNVVARTQGDHSFGYVLKEDVDTHLFGIIFHRDFGAMQSKYAGPRVERFWFHMRIEVMPAVVPVFLFVVWKTLLRSVTGNVKPGSGEFSSLSISSSSSRYIFHSPWSMTSSSSGYQSRSWA